MTSVRDRFRGALVGTAVGDALGAPFEGAAAVEDAELSSVADGTDPLRWTDDTAMAIGLARSLVDTGGRLDPEHLVRRFAQDHDDEPWRGYGPGPPHVFALVQAGVPADQAATRLFGGNGSFGNGGAMRVAPAAMAGHPDPDAVATIAAESARVTHAHEWGVTGAVLLALSVHARLTGPPRPHALLADLRAHAVADPWRHRLQTVGELLDASPPAGLVATELGTGIEALASVPTAIFAALHAGDAFAAAVAYAIRLGGDTDTIAAMTGAIAGAAHGLDGIPGRWLARLEQCERLIALADDLHDLGAGADAPAARP